MSMAETGTPPAGKTGFIVTMAALTAIAAVGGGIVGKLLSARLTSTAAVAAGQTTDTATPDKAAPTATPNYPMDIEVRELPPIVTNLSDPSTTHIRLQVAIAFSKKSVDNPTVLLARISEDIVAFLKTSTLREIQGASGLQNLREDLNERAATRSQGAVREIIIETLVTQ